MNPRVVLLLALLTAGALFWRDDEPAQGPVLSPSASTPGATLSTAPAATATASELPMLVSRDSLFPESAPSRTMRDLFAAHGWAAPSPKPSEPISVAAPDFPLSYIGKKREDGAWTVFLSRDDMTMVAKEGDILEQVYQVISIAPPVLTVTYLPMNHRYSLAIGDGE